MRIRRSFSIRGPRLIALSIVLVVTCLAAMPAHALGTVELDGRVQWISAGKIMLAPAPGGLPVSVDITQVPQDQYVGVAPGSRVAVQGVVVDDGRRVIATAITSLPAPEAL
jgi:hypothetical protein